MKPLLPEWTLNKLVLPGGLAWRTNGLKYLGVFLSTDVLMKNWDGVLELFQGKLKKNGGGCYPPCLLEGGPLLSTTWCLHLCGIGLQWWTLLLVYCLRSRLNLLFFGTDFTGCHRRCCFSLKTKGGKAWCTWPAGEQLLGYSLSKGFCMDPRTSSGDLWLVWSWRVLEVLVFKSWCFYWILTL